jgi:hypothetical protein
MDSHKIQIDDICYVRFYKGNELKTNSLEDNVYFTLRDIFGLHDDFNFALQSNYLNHELTGGICYEERDEIFKYANSLNEIEYLTKLIRFLKYIYMEDFTFEKVNDNDLIEQKINLNTFILFKDWFQNLKNLIKLLKNKLLDINI